jgi:hypothetical protein
MALATIGGKITDIKTGTWGVGYKIAEHINIGDKNFDRSWMCWIKSPETEHAIGDQVTITGELQVQLAKDHKTGELRGITNETTGQLHPYLDFSLYNCRVETASW